MGVGEWVLTVRVAKGECGRYRSRFCTGEWFHLRPPLGKENFGRGLSKPGIIRRSVLPTEKRIKGEIGSGLSALYPGLLSSQENSTLTQ